MLRASAFRSAFPTIDVAWQSNSDFDRKGSLSFSYGGHLRYEKAALGHCICFIFTRDHDAHLKPKFQLPS